MQKKAPKKNPDTIALGDIMEGFKPDTKGYIQFLERQVTKGNEGLRKLEKLEEKFEKLESRYLKEGSLVDGNDARLFKVEGLLHTLMDDMKTLRSQKIEKTGNIAKPLLTLVSGTKQLLMTFRC